MLMHVSHLYGQGSYLYIISDTGTRGRGGGGGGGGGGPATITIAYCVGLVSRAVFLLCCGCC